MKKIDYKYSEDRILTELKDKMLEIKPEIILSEIQNYLLEIQVWRTMLTVAQDDNLIKQELEKLS